MMRVRQFVQRWVAFGVFSVGTLVGTCCATRETQAAPPPELRVSGDHRFLVTASGEPFFWLADTAWELFHRLDREQAERYLDVRAEQGYTVIQAVALAELDGVREPNAYGHLPLRNQDPTQPDVRDGEQNDYWDHVDFIVQAANARGIYVGLLPTWGDKWNQKWGVGPEIFTPENAEAYGRWIGARYRDAGVVWILGGDRPVESDGHRAIIRAMAAGLKQGDGGRHLMTWHPTGGAGSSEHFHDDSWLDFNMRQNGHNPEFTGRYDATRADYERMPAKPVVDGEPIYEGHPVSFNAKMFGHSIAADVRRPLYWDLFQGAFGHTYGHHSVWQMWTMERKPVNDPLVPWDQAIMAPGAAQMQYGRWLLESRPFLTRVPDDQVIVADRVATNVPGSGRYRFVATRDQERTYAMVYAPIGRSFQVHLDAVGGTDVVAWWFSPRDGRATLIGKYKSAGVHEFSPPDPGEMLDWVLVLDDAAKNYPPPGTRPSKSQ